MATEKAPPTPNAGSVRLTEALKERAAKAALAHAYGLTREVVSRWASGERKPTPPFRAKLQEDYKIHWQAWDLPPDAQLPEVAAGPETFRASGAPSGS